MSTLYSIGQMNQLGDALEAAGFSPDEVTKLRAFSDLALIKKVLFGAMQITPVEHLIDLDADPFLPDGWSVEEHIKSGRFEWDPAKVALYLSKNQRKDKTIGGHKLREELKGKPVFNADLLDYLLAHPNIIPEEWKGKLVFFWGTIYRNSDGRLCVRYLCWHERLDWGCCWLVSVWYGHYPAAVRAS